MADQRKPAPATKNVPADRNISIGGDVLDSVVVTGDNNTVNQTIIQKFFNIFKSDSETLEHRNRRILLGHVENAWIKGVLDASLHGAALLDLGIKEDPEAVTKYPWAIKKESTDETLPAGTSMLEIFDSIGMGRSLLILGAPGSGKTTMLLELARQLIQRGREDVIAPIPMVFNLTSWTEKLSLADWLAQELNNLYSVPRKTAPDWVKGDKLLLLLDGLDEVRQDSRAKCVEAINAFRKEHGLTSLAVCSRSQDYADLNAKLSFEGAIEVQPLTQGQIAEFFNRFGKEMAGIKQVLKKDSALREMAETPLFLSIMIMAYRDKQNVDILVSKDENAQRKHLFDTYIERMFERPRLKYLTSQKQDVLHWLSWLASKMVEYNQIPYSIEAIQPNWLGEIRLKIIYGLITGTVIGLMVGLTSSLMVGPVFGLAIGLMISFIVGLSGELMGGLNIGSTKIKFVEKLKWSWKEARDGLLVFGFMFGLIGFLIGWLLFGLTDGLKFGVIGGLIFGLIEAMTSGLQSGAVGQADKSGQKIYYSINNAIITFLLFGITFMLSKTEIVNRLNWLFQIVNINLVVSLTVGAVVGGIGGLIAGLVLVLIGSLSGRLKNGLIGGIVAFVLIVEGISAGLSLGLIGSLVVGLMLGPNNGLLIGLLAGIIAGLMYGGIAVIQHYILRFILISNNLLPWRLVPFLDHCVDLIFLRRVGGGYIFVHRLLMEHFAAMYKEEESDQRIRSG